MSFDYFLFSFLNLTDANQKIYYFILFYKTFWFVCIKFQIKRENTQMRWRIPFS